MFNIRSYSLFLAEKKNEIVILFAPFHCKYLGIILLKLIRLPNYID